MKWHEPLLQRGRAEVVPLAGTWIEIDVCHYDMVLLIVVPLAGTWIEIELGIDIDVPVGVVPLAGTWIEIRLLSPRVAKNSRRPPRGDVD